MGGRRTFDVRFDSPDGEVRFEPIRFKLYQRYDDRGAMYSTWLGDRNLGLTSWLGHHWQGWDAFSYRDLDLMTFEQWGSVNRTLRRLGLAQAPQPEQFRPPDPVRRAEGFKTRRAAAEYLVRHWGFRGDGDE